MQGWKFSDYVLLLCEKVDIWIYDLTKILTVPLRHPWPPTGPSNEENVEDYETFRIHPFMSKVRFVYSVRGTVGAQAGLNVWYWDSGIIWFILNSYYYVHCKQLCCCLFFKGYRQTKSKPVVSLASLKRLESLNQVQALIGWGKGGTVTSAR